MTVGHGMSSQQKTESVMQARLEQCPMCDDPMIKGKYICTKCERRDNSITSTPPLMASEPEYKPEFGGCKRCGPERIDYCHERVRIGHWCSCELPDQLDFVVIGRIEVSELQELLSKKTTSRWNNKDGGIIDA